MKTRKVALIIVSVLIAICVLLSFSYAFYIITLSNRKDIAVSANIPSCAGVMLTSDTKITLTGDNTAPVSDAKALSSTNYRYSFTVSNGCSSAATMKVALAPTTTSTMSPRAIKYAIYESDGTIPSTGSFLSDNGKTLASDIANEVSNITGDTVEYGFEILSTTLNAGASKTYYVYVWVDKDEGGFSNNTTMDSTFYGHLVVTDYSSLGETYISAMPANTIFEEQTNQTSSQDSSSWAIVNEAGGLRYEGKDPDNYVCFKNSCTDDELYRIIGKFTELVDTNNDGIADTNKEVFKVIKSTSIAEMPWNTNNTSNWQTSTLKAYLDNTYTPPVNKSKILTTRWYLLSRADASTDILTMYDNERNGIKLSSNPEYVDSKIGLMYVSDLGLAALESTCGRTGHIFNYQYDGCAPKDWLYPDGINNKSWTITPHGQYNGYAFGINDSKNINGMALTDNYGVRPAFYLSISDTIIDGGNGSKTNPYIISSGSSNANLISFTIDGTTYYAEEGMTWVDWLLSSYNTDNLTIIFNGDGEGSYIGKNSTATAGSSFSCGNLTYYMYSYGNILLLRNETAGYYVRDYNGNNCTFNQPSPISDNVYTLNTANWKYPMKSSGSPV